MSHTPHRSLAAAAVLVVLTAPAGIAEAQTARPAAASAAAASTPMEKPSRAGALSAADRKFVEQAAMGGAAEVEAGRLAQQKAGNEAVKQFGSRMVQDHGDAGAELKQLATAKNVTLPNAPDATHQAEMHKLEKLSGAAFDREFTRMMVRDHEKVVAAFEKQSTSGSDPELKAFAAKTLPTLRTHLQMAKQIQSRAGAAPTASR
jgi:putative membrane protein